VHRCMDRYNRLMKRTRRPNQHWKGSCGMGFLPHLTFTVPCLIYLPQYFFGSPLPMYTQYSPFIPHTYPSSSLFTQTKPFKRPRGAIFVITSRPKPRHSLDVPGGIAHRHRSPSQSEHLHIILLVTYRQNV